MQTDWAVYLALAFAVANLALIVCVVRLIRSRTNEAGWLTTAIGGRFDALDRNNEALRSAFGDMNQGLRREIADGSRDGLAIAFDKVQEGTKAQAEQLGAFGRQLAEGLANLQLGMKQFGHGVTTELGKGRQGVTENLANSETRAADGRAALLRDVRSGFDGFAEQLRQQQEQLRNTVEGKLDEIRTSNEAKLEAMRLTVDEKLQTTLEQRLGASFKQVSDSLNEVYKSVGEMQALAVGVGDLKKVLTNIKSRGTWTEIWLETILAEVLTPEQYGRNVEVLPGSNQRVEFALRLPGDETAPVWLPIDVKFPKEDYERLAEAANDGDQEEAERLARSIETQIRAAARDIQKKYIQPPHSTDFAVMFLPTEGLFAEIVRRPGLVDALQRECRIMVAGPTTMATLLTAVRLGFRSLAIQQRSAEVWKVLGAVKHEFANFGGFIDKISRKLGEAQKVIDDDLGRRRRAMDRRLRSVETLPEAEAAALLEYDDRTEEPREAAE